ncbi:unnamed protein product [Mycena citricolor]|uniref:YTH domain-containing protein n=1 Tax=Mycena citricolor TaxID=2018698 RepID=A0AAD2HZ17_9AGAR|nr:unnamed protein product [Mycena citricolor]CAK5283846.1 unnamed protein product [Mycena citricolor]
MWVGNVPKHADETDLQTFFTQSEDHGVVSIFLLSKSSCAFVNFASEAHLIAAIQQYDGRHLRPEWSMGPALVCRVRTLNDDLWTGVGGQRGMGLHRQWIKDHAGPPNPALDVSDSHSPSSASDGSTTSSFFETHFPRRFFVLKCQTREELDRCAMDGVWYIQKHNQVVLDQSFRTSQETILFFSMNKSGQFYGYAKMISPVTSIGSDPLPHGMDAGDASPNLVVRVASPYSFQSGATQSAPSVLSCRVSDSGEFDHAGARQHRSLSFSRLPWLTSQHSGPDPQLEPELVDNVSGPSEGQPRLASGFSGQFSVEWLCREPLPFKRTRGIVNGWNRGREVKISRDGTELEPSAGSALIAAWQSWLTEPNRHRQL